MRFSLDTDRTNNSNSSTIIDQAILLAQDYLTRFALSENFLEQIGVAFGNRFDPAKLEKLRQQWASGQFEAIPEIEIRPAAEINGAIGAFSADTNRIFLSQEFIEQNISNSETVVDVLLEEIGHFVDAQINALDASGDEGAIFAALAQRETLSASELQSLKNEDDAAILVFDAKPTLIEQANTEPADHTYSWTVNWGVDAKGEKLWPVRESTVDYVLDIGKTRVSGSTTTDLQGKIFISSANVPSKVHLTIQVDRKSSEIVKHFVGNGSSLYSVEVEPNLNKKTIDIGNQSVDKQAFSISDALYVGEEYAKNVRKNIKILPVPELPRLLSIFPSEKTAYARNPSTILVALNDWNEWDAIHHEYGHFLANQDDLDSVSINNPLHQPGISGIAQLDSKLNGIEVGWSEGLAVYLSQAIREVTDDLGILPDVPGVDNTQVNYNIPLIGGSTKGSFDIETPGQDGLFRGSGTGEGDELSVARILWDLADGTREPFDRISISHKELYNLLFNIKVQLDLLDNRKLDRLDNVWDHFYNKFNKSNDIELEKYGAIFEKNGVSPRPLEPINTDTHFSSPIFRWQKGNEAKTIRGDIPIVNANDEFEVIIFDSQFNRLLESGLLKQGSGWTATEATWQPSQAEWNKILDRGIGQRYYFVVSGSDTKVDSNPTDSKEATGPYWSGAYTFQVGDVPPQKVFFAALLDKGLDNLNIFQSKTNPLMSNLPIFGNKFQSSSRSGQATQASQSLVVDGVSADTGASDAQFLLSEVSDAAATGGLNFLGKLSEDIKQKFSQKFGSATEATVEEIQNTFFELLGPSGKGILKDSDDPGDAITKDDIGIILDGSIVQFNIKLGGQEKLADITLPSNLGLPWLGFEFNDPKNPNSSQPEAGVNLDYTFDLGFGIDTTTNDFFFETSPNKDLTITLTPSFPDATAKLGFLQVNAQNKGSKVEFSVDIDDGEDGNDQLTLDEISQGKLRFTPDGSANVNLHLDSSIAGSTLLPSIGADLNLGWNFTDDAADPSVNFDNVELKLGSFFKTLAGPALSGIQTIIEPLQTVTDLLDKKLPIIQRSIAKLAADPNLSITNPNIDQLVKTLPQINKLLASIPKNPEQLDSIPIKLGSFNLPDIDTNASNLSNGSIAANPDKQPTETPLQQVKKVQSNFVTQLDATPSFKFPILTEPENVINLLLGKEADLLKAELPPLGLGFEYTQIIPIFGPIVATITGKSGAVANLGFGVDSQGLYVYTPQGQQSNLLGQFPSLANHTAGLTAGIAAGVGASVGAITANIDAGIEGNLFLDLSQPRTYISDLSDLDCILTTSGNISAVVAANLKIGWSIFSYRKRIELVRETVADFRRDSCSGPEEDHGQAVVGNGNLMLSVGAASSNLKKIDPNDIKPNEFISVEHTSGTLGNETVTVAAYDTTWTYDQVNQITADGGEGDDVILLGDKVLTKAKLTGGEGRDELQGGAGNDELQGDAERDTLLGGSGDDILHGGDGDDRLLGDGKPSSQNEAQGNPGTNELSGNDTLWGDSGNDELLGGAGNDELRGGSDDDFLDGGSGDDRLFGEDGDDILRGGAGADRLEGGAGKDSTSYKDSPSSDGINGVRLNLSNHSASVRLSNGQFITLAAKSALGGDAEGDTFDGSIENIEGSNYADVLIGDDSIGEGSGNVLDGGDGNDILIGGQGDDLLFGGKGVDTLDGGEGEDGTTYLNSSAEVFINLETGKAFGGDAEGEILIAIEDVQGSKYNDVLIGNDSKNNLDGSVGDDRLTGNGDADILDGGEGIDWAIYDSSPEAVNVSLKEGKGKSFGVSNSDGGDGRGDILKSIENLEGSAYNDSLEGDFKQNILEGLAGDDTLRGDEGNDTLIGGAGKDTLDGGGGIDWADYSDSPDYVVVDLAGTGANADAQGDTFEQIKGISTVENLLGSDYGDTLTGDNGNNEINPGVSSGGVDRVDGKGGNDLLTLDYSANDFGIGMIGGFNVGSSSTGAFFRGRKDGNSIQDDQVSFSNIERLNIFGTKLDDEIYGGIGNDILRSSRGNDTIYGGRGSNTIDAGDGNDKVIDQTDINRDFSDTPPGDNVISLDGGHGIDTLSIDLSGKSTSITLESNNPDQENPNQLFSSSDGTVAIRNFEIFQNIKTGNGNNKLTQLGRVNNSFSTGFGDDIINPGLGFDVVDGGFADGSGNDLLILDYSVEDTGSGMSVSINPESSIGEAFRTVSASSSERLDNIKFSNFSRYQITGTSKADQLEGGNGDDTLIGGADNDILIGGKRGQDNLTGGVGTDMFVLGDFQGSYYADPHGENDDYASITDFNPGEGDLIQLSAYDNYFLAPSPSDKPAGIGVYRGYISYRNYPEYSDLMAIIPQGSIPIDFINSLINQGDFDSTSTGIEKYFSFVGQSIG